MHRQFAGKLTSPVTKWVVAVLWILIAAGGATFGSKLSQVTDDQASSWVPSSAESTRALNKLDVFQSPNDNFFPLDETWSWAGNANGSYRLPGGVTISGFLQSANGLKGARTNR